VSAGKHVLLADLRIENAKAAADLLSGAGFEVSTATVDVSSRGVRVRRDRGRRARALGGVRLQAGPISASAYVHRGVGAARHKIATKSKGVQESWEQGEHRGRDEKRKASARAGGPTAEQMRRLGENGFARQKVVPSHGRFVKSGTGERLIHSRGAALPHSLVVSTG
jgi:hypothetical protein